MPVSKYDKQEYRENLSQLEEMLESESGIQELIDCLELVRDQKGLEPEKVAWADKSCSELRDLVQKLATSLADAFTDDINEEDDEDEDDDEDDE